MICGTLLAVTELIDKGNADYNLTSGDITIEFSRGIDPISKKPQWRLWALRMTRHSIAGFGSGKLLKESEFTRKLEKLYNELPS
jgi:hypothetical protein